MRLFSKTILLLTACFPWLAGNAQNVTRPNVKAPNGFEVNSYTGNLFHTRTDLKVAALPLPLNITFYYNQSRRSKDWGFGPGWTFTYNLAYVPDSLGIYIERGDGRRDLFKKAGNAYTAPTGVFDQLTEYSPGRFKLTSKEGTVWYFDNAVHKKLTKLQDRNNNVVSLSYTDSLLSAITDVSGHTYGFTWNNGLLTQISDNCTSPVQKTTYAYDTTRNPVKVTNPLGDYVSYYYTGNKMVGYGDERGYKMSMAYTPGNAIEKIVSCVTVQTFAYAAKQRKTFVTESVNGQKQITTYTFDSTGRVAHKQGNCCGYNVEYKYDANNDIAAVKNGNNQTTRYEYDRRGNVIKEIDPLGYSVTYTYDTVHNKVKSIKDKKGYTTAYEYDAAGNRSKIIKPGGITESYTYDAKGAVTSYTDGNGYKTSYEYDGDGFVTKMTDATNRSTQYTYDCHGNRTSETDARGNTTFYQYNALNQLVKTTDAGNRVTQYGYDKSGNLETVTNPLGKTTTYQYDGLNRRIKTTGPMGISTETVYDEQGNVVKTIDGNGKAKTYTYNSRRQTLTETDALGNTTSYDYDEGGNQTSIRDKKGGITRFEYDDLNRLVKQVNAMNGSIAYTYDANGNRITETDANGNTSAFAYDSLNRLVSLTDPLRNTVAYTYDAANNRLSEKDKNGHYTYYAYDSLNRVKKVTDALGGQSAMTYDEAGNVLTETDGLGHTTRYTYDGLNRRLSAANALNETTVYTYDGAGNSKTVTQPNGNVILNFYDDDNRLKKVTDAIGTVAEYAYDGNGNLTEQKDGNGNPTRFEYDAAARKVKHLDAFNHATVYTYDAVGNLVKETDRNGYPKSYSYDALNRRTSETDALGHTTRFTYDANGNRLNVIDAKGNTTSYNYDALNRLAKEIYADGTTRQFTYDAAGNQKTRKDGNGVITVYTYDAANRMTARSYPDGTADTYSYDSVGRRKTANNQNATIALVYDNANRMLSETLNGKTTGYAYNTAARTKMLTYPSGRVIVEERDKRDRLIAVKEGGTAIATFTYDSADRLTQKVFANGFSENYAYNANNWLTVLTCQPGNVLNVQYTYDNEGNKLTASKNHRPTHSEKYVYDSIYQLTGFYNGKLIVDVLSDTIGKSTYSYDVLYNRIWSVENNVAKQYYVNNINGYDSVKTSGAKQIYNYDRNGNTVSNSTDVYSYDNENRLSSINDNSLTQNFYDAMGRRIKSITPQDTINFFWNGSTVIEKVANRSFDKESFVLGAGLDDLIEFKKNDSTYYLINSLSGSIHGLLGHNLKERFEYEPFGKPNIYDAFFSPTNSFISNDLVAFNGRPLFSNKLHDFRARAYDDGDGRFLQRDPLGSIDSYNFYQFAYNSPINKIDNLGLSAQFPCGNYPNWICDFIEKHWTKWLGESVQHEYTVNTKICDMPKNYPCPSENSPLCNQSYIFNLMLSKKEFVAPAIPSEADDEMNESTASLTHLQGPNLVYATADLFGLWYGGIVGALATTVGLYAFGFDFSNPIRTGIHREQFTAVNYTIFPHLFYPGTIARTVENINGSIWIHTRGSGKAVHPAIKYLNIYGGEAIFKMIDYKLKHAYESAIEAQGDYSGGGGSFGGGGATGKY